jgi:hypothetical protein
VNCWKPLRAMNTTTELAIADVNVLKRAMDWAISSQASWEQDEGSTTRLSNLEQKKSPRVRKVKNSSNLINKTVGGEDMDKLFFVYKTINLTNNHIYVGVHETYNIDDGYLGSGKLLKQAIKKYGKQNFKREIIKFCSCKQDAFELETQIVNSVFILREDVYNLTEGGKGVITHSSFGLECLRQASKNKVVVKNLLTGKIEKISKFDFETNPEIYTGHTAGKKVMKDQLGNIVITETDDCNLVGVTKGLTKAYDANGNIIMVSVLDRRLITGELCSTSKGKVVVKDANGNKFTVSKDDPRLISKELIGVASGKRYKQNKKRAQVTCPHCNKVGDSSNMKRWHFEHCKFLTKI